MQHGPFFHEKFADVKEETLHKVVPLLIYIAWMAAMAVLLSSCSADYYLRTAMRKDPSMFRDTLTTITVDRIPIAPVGETLSLPSHLDTLLFTRVLSRDSVIVKTVINYEDSTIYTQVDCPDAEIITKTISLPPEIVYPSMWGMFKKVWWLIPALVLLAFGLKLIYSILKPL